MFWDSRVLGLEAQALVPLRTRGEMLDGACRESEALAEALGRVRAIPEYRERFRSAFGDSAGEVVTAENLGRAIAAFERTLVTPDTALEAFLDFLSRDDYDRTVPRTVPSGLSVAGGEESH